MTETKEADFKKEMRAVALMERRVAEALRDKEQFRRYIVTEKRGGDTSTEEYVLGKVDFKAMGEALKTVKTLIELKRLASGQTEGDGVSGLVVLPGLAEAEDEGDE